MHARADHGGVERVLRLHGAVVAVGHTNVRYHRQWSSDGVNIFRRVELETISYAFSSAHRRRARWRTGPIFAAAAAFRPIALARQGRRCSPRRSPNRGAMAVVG